MHIHMYVDIEAPPGRVWPYLVEPHKIMQWYTALKKFEFTNGAAGPDSTFYWEEKVGGKVYETHFKTTEWVEDRVFGYEMTSGNSFKVREERWEVSQTPTGCRFSWYHHAHTLGLMVYLHDVSKFRFGPLGKIMGWLFERLARRMSKKILSDLRRLAEEEVV